MADAAVTFLLENVTQLIIQEADRLGNVQVEIRGIEEQLEELEQMASVLLDRSDQGQNQILDVLATQIKRYINEAETLIEEYTAIASERATAGIYKKILYRREQGRRAQKLKDFIVEVTEYRSKLMVATPILREEVFPDDQRRLPRYLRRLIYYFLLFPDNFEIPARRLIVLWVAEGLIRSSPNNINVSIEDIAKLDLNKLIEWGLVRVTKKKLNGETQACSLQDGIRDQWLEEATEANFFQSRRKQVRRLVDQTATADASFIRIHGNPSISGSVPKYGDVISFLSFDTQEGSKPGEDIGDFLHKCIQAERFLWLRILDLEKVFRPKLPETLCKLIRLKYLGLRWTYLQKLPNFVNELLQLQVLDVKHTYITLLPSSIWRMQDLRHLYLSEAYRTRFPRRPRSEVSNLTQLQTLWGAFIDEDTHVIDGLDTLEGIRKLGLSCRPRSGDTDMSEQLIAVDKWISKLGNIQNLRLKSRDKEGEAADLHLSTLEANTNLSTVYLLGRLNPSVVEKFPQSLTDITLSGSELNMDPMGFLGKLPKLGILRFLAKSVLHSKLHCSQGGFPQLKVVHIWCLENLEEWEVEEGSLPCLENFEIRSCPNLKNLPGQLKHLDTIQKFWLTRMPEGFMHETKLRQSQLWAKIDHAQQQL